VKQKPPDINQTAILAGIVGQVGCITVLMVVLALGAGIFLDRFLDTRPVFTILFMVGSVPVTLYIIVRVSLTALARAQRAASAEKLEEETEE
jgi:F0F1-type ATP synthase assembly protein I